MACHFQYLNVDIEHNSFFHKVSFLISPNMHKTTEHPETVKARMGTMESVTIVLPTLCVAILEF